MDGIMALIPAAGASRRMRGRDKLLEPVAGVPILARAVAAACAGGAAPVLVTLAPGAAARRAALAGSPATIREVPEAAEGMAASLRAGAQAARKAGAAGLLILLPDLPEIEGSDVARLIAAHAAAPAACLRATAADGQPGHPVLLPARCLPALALLHGDTGARAVLAAEGPAVLSVPLPGLRAVTDLDTPEDWLAWRARTGR